MKKGNNIFYGVLFGLLMAFLFLSLIQQHFHVFKFRQLSGYEEPTAKPAFTLQSYQSGKYQRQLEQYLSENLGFREPIIRMYNQYVFDFYQKTYNDDVAIEKDGWLYHTDGLKDYFGWMQNKYHATSESFARNLDLEMRNLYKVNAILKEYGVDLMVFTLPVKTHVYPQHLKNHPFIDTTFNATKYYEQGLTQLGIPFINMDSWMKQVQDTLSFPLFPERGSHWAAGAPLAVDTMLRMMESISGKTLTKIELGQPYPIYNVPECDKDLEMLLNLARPMKFKEVIEYPVTLHTDEQTCFPSVYFIGTSFYWYMDRRVPFDKLFKSRVFQFYSSLFYKHRETVNTSMDEVDMLWELLSHDFVVFFRNGPQLYMDGFFFANNALYSLCLDEHRYAQRKRELADSLRIANNDEVENMGIYLYKAQQMLMKNTDLFEELRGDSIPSIRNPKIPKMLVKRDICKDDRHKGLLQVKAQQDSVDFGRLLELEVEYLMKGHPSLTENLFLNSYDFFDMEINACLEHMSYEKACQQIGQRVSSGYYLHDTLAIKAFALQSILHKMNNANTLKTMKEKATWQGKTLEKAIRDDALWSYRHMSETPVFSEVQIQEFWEQYAIEHWFRTNPESMKRIREKADNKGVPLSFAIMDDVLYVYNQSKEQ